MELTSDEEIALIKKQLLRRSIGVMEGCNNASGGEVRRVNIVYYLSVNGKIQHPHLIRVRIHHNGVRLRDVKRWLSDLRGKDMPDSFTWSYKRRYKMGFVWQDLMDDDLITPICDNEYVIMGSQLPSPPYPFSIMDALSCGEKTPKRNSDIGSAAETEEKPHVTPPKPTTEDLPIETGEGVSPEPRFVIGDPRQSSDDPIEALKSSNQQDNELKQGEKQDGSFVGEGRRKSSRRVSRVVRNMLTCGLVEAGGTPLLSVSRRKRDHHNFHPFNCITRILPLCFRGTGSL